MSDYTNDLIAQGLARVYRGRLIPIMQGGDGRDEEDTPLFPVAPDDLAALSDEDLATFITEADQAVRDVLADPASFVSAELPVADLREQTKATIDALAAARTEVESRQAATEEVELTDDDVAAFADLAETLTSDDGDEDEDADGDADKDADGDADGADDSVVASGDLAPKPKQKAKAAARRALPTPAKSRRAPDRPAERVALTAAGSMDGFEKGEPFPSMEEVAKVMQARRRNFGIIADGTQGEKIPIVRADWSHLYPEDRQLTTDAYRNEALVAAVVEDDGRIRAEMANRRDNALVASGGLCAPVTPYYQLAMVSVADRPVRAALPAFNADRGGIRYARPATLGDITTAVGVRTAAQDAAGGTTAQKTCQVVSCPPFQETDVEIIFHCLQFGNLGARTFPERVTQWNGLTLAAHARLAETGLLTGIDTASTQVTASDLGLGTSASLFSQIMTAGAGMRSRNRMRGDAVLRIMLPWWSVYEIVSDVYRGQFQRFDIDVARVTALLRGINVEPTFYVDSASGRGQVYGTQSAGALLAFPDTIVWYLFPEGSFLYLDGGTLELGLVRDSVLNKTNDFQIFGETFENVAFVGVESLAVESTICDSGAVSLPQHVTACGNYA